MPCYQLEVSIPLVGAAFCSLAVYLLSALSRKPSVQLPFHDDEDFTRNDPFNIMKPEDVLHGQPIDGDVFWKKMRLRKIAAVTITAIILGLMSVCLGWSAGVSDYHGTIVYSLHVVFALYILVLGGIAVAQDETELHTRCILHLTILTFIASLLLGSITVLSSAESVRANPTRAPAFDIMDILWIISVLLYIILCVIYITTPFGPAFWCPPDRVYSDQTIRATTKSDPENVSGEASASLWDRLMFAYTTKVVYMGNAAASIEIGDLPIVAADMRGVYNFTIMRAAMRKIQPKLFWWTSRPGSGWGLLYKLVKVNQTGILSIVALSPFSALGFLVPPFFMQRVLSYLEADPERQDRRLGFVFSLALFVSSAILWLVTGQLWSLCTTTIQVRSKNQMNTLLFSKTLLRRDVAPSTPSSVSEKIDEDSFSSKAQIMNLMTIDVERISKFGWHLFALIDAPIEATVGIFFVYKLIGVSAFIGLAVTIIFLPISHYAGLIVVRAQGKLMKARDERAALMNEILGGIRMLKFMALERSFEKRVLAIRTKELRYQKLNYTIQTLWNGIWNAVPVFVILISFWHFTVIRENVLTPSTAFTALALFTEIKFALSVLPEIFINVLQTFVSLRRVEDYLMGEEVAPIPPLREQSQVIGFQDATATWPQHCVAKGQMPSASSVPHQKFSLTNLNFNFPLGEMSLVCGKLGSGKSLLLLALLGEADILAGQIVCPRSPPDSLASFASPPREEDWVVQGMCAYVPQTPWLRTASIRENILFNLPYNQERYQKTVEACALITDFRFLEDGDESEIGERGVNLSGGQKARVSLARAVYSRASILLLDDVLSAVDAHTAHHLYHHCLKGEIMSGRTMILVSHHIQLCAPGAKFIVALDNGRVKFSGEYDTFQKSGVMKGLIQTFTEETAANKEDPTEGSAKEKVDEVISTPGASQTSFDSNSAFLGAASGVITDSKSGKKKPRKFVEEETRAVGRIQRAVWETYFWACGGRWYWFLFPVVMVLAAITPVLENGWLKIWSGSADKPGANEDPLFYITIYAGVVIGGLVITTVRWYALYRGSIHASVVLYQRLLEAVLFADMRFHDTVSRGRLLNRFCKDFEGIDSSLSDNLGRSIINGLSVIVTFVTIIWTGGLFFFLALCALSVLYWKGKVVGTLKLLMLCKVYGQTSRDMRRLDSVTRSPLYNIYNETISGITIIRAFGGSSQFLRDMICHADTNTNPFYWSWSVNRWLLIRFNLLSSTIVGLIALVAVSNPAMSASLAGFALTLALPIIDGMQSMVRRFVALEQSMVALERVKEFSELKPEPAEFVEPRPPVSWPSEGHVQCENLVIRYAPNLPNVLHNLSFEVKAGEKIGILGRTGSGKSTLALSFFRFVEAIEGRIIIDGVDISKVGLADLRSKLTIIPQDPIILSGTLRSTLDVSNEYEDAEIFEALRRVQLILSGDPDSTAAPDIINSNVFCNLESVVSEGGENFSTGEKQLLCMARAILKRSKILIMDEATASVDYSTDEKISKTIQQEFASSTIFTIAHRLRTVIDYDRVMILDAGQIVEFANPAGLLHNPASQFYKLCQATGTREFATLKQLAEAKAAKTKDQEHLEDLEDRI